MNKKEVEQLLEKSLIKSNITIEEFKKELNNKSFNYDELIEFNAKQKTIFQFINEVIFKDIKLDENEAINFYKANPEKFITKEEIKASHILVNTSQEAKKIITKLINGDDFTKLAKEYSIGPSAIKGGDLGYFSKGMMVPEFEEAAFKLEKTGDFTKEPIKTQFGYHIIKLTGKKEATNLDFDQVKNNLESELLKIKQNKELINHIDTLFKKSNVKIYITDNETKI